MSAKRLSDPRDKKITKFSEEPSNKNAMKVSKIN